MERTHVEEDYLMLEKPDVTMGEPIGAGYGAINAGEHDQEHLDFLAEKARDHLVAVSPDAPSCCIDGRTCVHTLANGETSPRPSVAGGPVTAYAAAELTGLLGDDDGTPAERFTRVIELLNNAGLPTGNHIDETAEACGFADGKTGCGAADRFLENLGHVSEDREAVLGVVSQLLGGAYDADHTTFTDNGSLMDRNADWNSVTAVNVLAVRDQTSIEVLQSDDTPTHGHNEVFVAFNYVENTTIDRDAYVAETGAQLFDVDMWYIDKMARALASGPDADAMYDRLRHAMVAYQVGTYLTLCNGTQRPLLLTEAASLAA